MSSTTIQVVLKALDKYTSPLKKISKENAEASKKIRQINTQLKILKGNQHDLKTYSELKAKVGSLNSELGKNNQELRKVAKKLRDTAEPSDRLKKSFEKAKKRSAQLSTELSNTKNKLKNVNYALKESGISTSRLASSERKLNKDIVNLNKSLKDQKSIYDQLYAAEKRREQAYQKGRRTFDKGKSLTIGGGGAALTTARGLSYLGNAMSTGMDFEATMSKVQALSRLSKDSADMKELTRQARNLGASTSFSAVQAANAQAFLAMAGFDPKAIQKALPGLLDMSKAGGADLGRGADIASNILGSFKLQPQEMGKVADILTKAFTTSNTNLEMLANTMKYVGPVAQSAGMDLETAAAMAGLLGNVGIQSEKAGTTLRAMLLRLSAPAGAASKAMEKLGLDAKDANGNVRNMVDILAETAKATEKMGSAERLKILKDIFGEEPAAGMAELISQAGSGGIVKYLEVIKNHEGAARQTANVMGDNLKGLVTQYKSAVADLQISLFDGQNGALTELVKSITDTVRGISAWVKENPKLAATVVKISAALLALITVIGGLAAIIGIVTMMAGAFGMLSLSALPVIAVIGLLVAAGWLLYKNWDAIKGGAIAMWQDLGNFLESHWQRMKGGAMAILEDLKALPGKLTQIGRDMAMGLVNGIKEKIGALKETITGMGSSAIGALKEKLDINSPSRVFASLGNDTMAGFAQGINQGGQAPLGAIGQVAKNLAANGALAASIAATPAAAITQGGATAAPMGYNITINITAPAGADAQALAALVRDTLDERDRQKAARGRSALYDTD